MPVENNNNNNNSDYDHRLSEEQFWPTISADIATIHKLLDSEEPVVERRDICSTCNMPFDKGKKRKLIDTCGHERCYTCVFRNEACPLCNSDNVKPPKKPISRNTSSNDIYGDMKKSVSVNSIGHTRPKVKTNGHFTSVMQARHAQDDYSWRDVSPSRLPRPNRTSEPSTSSPINHDQCATPPQNRRKMFNTKGGKNYVWGLRGSSNSFNTISDDESGSVKPMNMKGKEESQRNLYTRLGLLLGDTSPGVKTPSSNQIMNSSISVSSLASLDIANFPSSNTSPVSTLTGSSETDAHRGTIKEASLDSVGSIMSMSSQSNCSLSPRSRRHSVTTTHPGPIEELSMFKNRRTSIRRSARAATIKGPIDPKVRFAQYRTNQLTLKPLFFEVPTQEADPLFTGRDWLLKELEELIKKETTSGISINGLPGSGKTALILQLVDHSCFGRRRETTYKQGVDTINGKDRPSSSEHSIYCQVNLVSSRVSDLASRVVAYHFCQADNYVTCAVPDFIHSIAAQLCQAPQLTTYKDYLLSEPYLQEFLSMKECIVDPDLAFTRGVLEPLCSLKRTNVSPGEDVLILVDGICEAEYHRPDHGDTIASFLAKHISNFPTWLKVIVTVRTHLDKVIPTLPFNKISLDINGGNGDNIQKDLSDYINYRVHNSPSIQNNLVTGAAGQYRFSQHLQGLSKGSFLFAKLTLDLFEKGNLVAKSTSFKVLPVSLGQIFLLHFNLRFPTTAAFEKVSAILNVALAAVYPLTLSELYYSVNSLNVHTFITWEDFQQRIKTLGGLLIKRMDNTYMLFHPTFREWLIKRDENESNKFLCDIRTGHAGIAFRLSRLEAPLNAEKTLELGHHLLKAHIYKNMTLMKYSSTDMQSYWICSVSENVSDALCFLRNVYSPNAKVSRLLLLSGASANHHSDFLGQAPVLCLFAHEGMSDMVALLLEFGADVHLTNSQGCTALILAAMRGHTDVVCQLVAAGAALGKTDTAGRCAIVHAARNGHLNIVAYLLSCDWVLVDPENEIDLKQAAQQALVAASSQGYIEILEYLLDMSEVDIDGEDSLTGETALTTAATNGCADVCSVLIERGCQISVTNRQEFSALMLAARGGHWTTVDRLVQYQLSVEQCDKQGRTPLMIASSEGHVDIILLLLDKGAKIDAEDYENMTSLCWACSRGRTQAAECLLDRGADINHSNKLGATPLNLAAFQGNPILVQLLLDRGAMIEHADLEGIRPLDRAISCRNIPVVQCFLRKGAKLGPTTWNMANGKQDVMLVLLNKLLEDGNVLLRKCRLNEASHRYGYALSKFPPLQQMDPTFRQLRLNFLLNYSRCKRKMNEPLEAVNLASEVLKFKPESYEALYARAKAFIDLRKNEEALSDIQEALLLLPPQKRDIRNVLLKLQYDIRDGSLSTSVTTLNSPTETSL